MEGDEGNVNITYIDTFKKTQEKVDIRHVVCLR